MAASADRGKCTIEVVVDGTAEVEIRGDQGTIRNLAGRPAEWRRFECNAPLPRNPVGFRFAGVDGRGRQQLMRDPRKGGVAVVRIEDSQGGSEGYTFDLFWGGGDDRGPGAYRRLYRLPAVAIAFRPVIVQPAASQRSRLSMCARTPSAGRPERRPFPWTPGGICEHHESTITRAAMIGLSA